MVKKHTSQQNTQAQSGTEQSGLSRRSFLKSSLVGLGALALPACTVSEASPSVVIRAGDSASLQTTTFNPLTAKDNWVQPWEWRTSDWPGQPLNLNVVEHAAPIAVFGEADDVNLDVQKFLFSYNGISPGPTIRVGSDETLYVKLRNMLPPNKNDFCRPENMNTPHQQHTTNLHTHGLHVQPSRNPDGTFADNVILRVIPQGDYHLRENSQSPACWPLRGNEVVAEANFQFRLGKSGGAPESHPPGTHWYHPHSHGATHDQVASGMAGFLIVEGDVDESLKAQIPEYRERLIFIQRVRAPKPKDDEGFIRSNQVKQKSAQTFASVNGQATGQRTIVMKPNAIEHWRVLNGSVDGQGYIQFMVVEGSVPENLTDQNVFLDDLNNRQPLHLLATDGVTLVRNNPATNTAEHFIKTLDKDKTLLMAPANRADFLFKAPALNGQSSRTFTVVAKYYGDAIDLSAQTPLAPNIIIATVIVRDGADGQTLPDLDPANDLTLPPVPAFLQPIEESELVISAEEANLRGNPAEANKLRTRQLIYSGWGQARNYDPQLSANNTMAIDCQKFDPEKTPHHSMYLGTAEEWTIWNCSLTIRDGDKNLNAVDHPFHIHVSPFWVTGMFNEHGHQIDLNGNLAGSPNYDFEPRWQDTIRIPRNGGWVTFRSRFWDYTGEFVNHCHILQHEDNGMMQTVQIIANPERINYVAKNPGYQHGPDFTISQDECIQINLDDRRTCQTVLNRIRRPAP